MFWQPTTQKDILSVFVRQICTNTLILDHQLLLWRSRSFDSKVDVSVLSFMATFLKAALVTLHSECHLSTTDTNGAGTMSLWYALNIFITWSGNYLFSGWHSCGNGVPNKSHLCSVDDRVTITKWASLPLVWPPMTTSLPSPGQLQASGQLPP